MPEITPITAFSDNYIWLLRQPGGTRVALVDPGDAAPVLHYLDVHKTVPVALLITHHHRDHTGGIAELCERFDLPVYGPANESIEGVTHPLDEGMRIELPEIGLEFTAMATPGHTRGHLCYTGHGALFCGDTLFTAGCGRLFEGTPEQMHASLSRLAALAPDTQVYCAHEYTADNLKFALVVEPDNPDIRARIEHTARLRADGQPSVPSKLSLELQTNPFLRSQVPAVIAAAEHFCGHRLATGAEVFACLRHWKDTLD
jgi:hydroxyacylglutathione hydrolase